MSDHNLLVLSSQCSPIVHNKEFRFELAWLKDHDFIKNVQRIWDAPTRDENPLMKVQYKIKKVKKFLKGWGFNRAGSPKKRKKEIYEAPSNLEQKEEESTLNEEQIRGRCTLLAELYKMLEEEELY
jgi:hypothetical protein